jgi:hypothetical protein
MMALKEATPPSTPLLQVTAAAGAGAVLSVHVGSNDGLMYAGSAMLPSAAASQWHLLLHVMGSRSSYSGRVTVESMILPCTW